MKRNQRYWAPALLAALLVLCLIGVCGCRKAPPQKNEEDVPPDDGELVTVTGIGSYKVIRPDNASTGVRTEAGVFYNTLKTLFPSLSIDVDYTKGPKPVVNDDYEILIGNTNRAETRALAEEYKNLGEVIRLTEA